MSAMASQIISDYILNRVFKRRSKKTWKFRVTSLCEGNSPVTNEFLAQRAINAENVSIWWRHHDIMRAWMSLWYYVHIDIICITNSRRCFIPWCTINNDWRLKYINQIICTRHLTEFTLKPHHSLLFFTRYYGIILNHHHWVVLLMFYLKHPLSQPK